MNTIQISKEQARLLWSIVNAVQNNGLNTYCKQLDGLTKAPCHSDLFIDSKLILNWTTETAKEHMALQAFKEQLVEILEKK
jgi:hypothetical protein